MYLAATRPSMAFLASRADVTLIQPQIETGPGLADLRRAGRPIERGKASAEQTADRCFDAKGRLPPGLVRERVDAEELAGAAR